MFTSKFTATCISCLLSIPLTLLADHRNAATIIRIDPQDQSFVVDTGVRPRITVDNEAPHNQDTFKIGDFTAITVNGAKAGFADLKPGMKVTVAIGTTGNVASSVTAFNIVSKPKVKVPKDENPKLFSRIERDKIISASANQISVSSAKGERVKAYRITESTQITVNGKKEAATALRPNMRVVINIGAGNDIAASVTAVDE